MFTTKYRIAMALCAAVMGAAAWPHATPQPTAPASCDQLQTLTIPGVSISSVGLVPAGSFSPTGTGRAMTVPTFCRVIAIATPTTDSRIAIEVWLPPATAWNGRFLGTDNGGFSGAIGYAAMASAVTRGYATAGTDTGHTGDQMDFGQGHPEKIIDWASRAIHVTAELGKLVARNHYGRFPNHAYFSGCSTGGQQALSEAQRFPGDYDGVVAGDPGNDRVRLILGFLWSWLATHGEDGAPLLAAPKLALVTKAAVAACDPQDGLTDGLIGEPRRCQFNPATLLCKGGETTSCLTPIEVTAVQKVYDGAKNARTGQQVFAGWARGSEQGWPQYITAPPEPVRIGFFRSFVYHDPSWEARTFDWDRDVDFVESQMPHLSAVSRDYSGFRARQGKILMYTGLADPVVPPENVTSYYEAVARASGGFPETQKFFRFFPVPGMGHCNGGAGPSTFDALGALQQWVEQGIAPTRIVAAHSTGGRVDRTRPLCPYPQTARYKGTGSIDDEASFVCGTAPPPRGRLTTEGSAR